MASFELSGASFPGAAGVERQALAGCQDEALEVLPEDGETLYDLIYFTPSSGTWATGDRTVTCVLFDPTGKPLIGSVLAPLKKSRQFTAPGVARWEVRDSLTTSGRWRWLGRRTVPRRREPGPVDTNSKEQAQLVYLVWAQRRCLI